MNKHFITTILLFFFSVSPRWRGFVNRALLCFAKAKKQKNSLAEQ